MLSSPLNAALAETDPSPRIYTAKEVIQDMRSSGKKVVTFFGYSGAGYSTQDEKALERIALRELLSLLRRTDGQPGYDFSLAKNYIINIGVTLEGIGAVYKIAKRLGLETRGIVSKLALPYLGSVENGKKVYKVENVDKYYLVDGESWGGKLQNGELTEVSEATVESTDYGIAVGGGDIGYDEMSELIHRGKPYRIYSAEMNHEKALKKNPNVKSFFGKMEELYQQYGRKDLDVIRKRAKQVTQRNRPEIREQREKLKRKNLRRGL